LDGCVDVAELVCYEAASSESELIKLKGENLSTTLGHRTGGKQIGRGYISK